MEEPGPARAESTSDDWCSPASRRSPENVEMGIRTQRPSSDRPGGRDGRSLDRRNGCHPSPGYAGVGPGAPRVGQCQATSERSSDWRGGGSGWSSGLTCRCLDCCHLNRPRQWAAWQVERCGSPCLWRRSQIQGRPTLHSRQSHSSGKSSERDRRHSYSSSKRRDEEGCFKVGR